MVTHGQKRGCLVRVFNVAQASSPVRSAGVPPPRRPVPPGETPAKPAGEHACATLNARTSRPRSCQGSLLAELILALAILTGTLLPVAYSFASERRMARAAYQRAVAMEIVDGEMEALLAGGWRAQPLGTHEYPVHAAAATNLPSGRFILSIEANKVRLEWQPETKNHGGPVVVREAMLK